MPIETGPKPMHDRVPTGVRFAVCAALSSMSLGVQRGRLEVDSGSWTKRLSRWSLAVAHAIDRDSAAPCKEHMRRANVASVVRCGH